jgi:DNA-directed RNA polymerase subunit M/transcription elongation factor TFIIS
MADIDIKCQKCGTVVTISEFADPSSIACRKCGEKLQKPDTPIQKQKPTVKVMKKEEIDPTNTDTKPPQEWRFHKHVHKEELKGQSAIFTTHHIASWIIFIVLGGLMGWIRYGGLLQPAQLAMLKQYAPFILLGLHIVIILTAFKHSVFQGILGVMIPPYPYYFLFAVADEFYLRAIVGGILVGMGQDALIFVSKESVLIYTIVTDWIAKGG